MEAPGSTLERFSDSGEFGTLDCKLAHALTKVITGTLGRSIIVEKEKMTGEGKRMTGRQILLMRYRHFRVTEAEGHIRDFRDLMDVKIRGDDLKAILAEWEITLTGMQQRAQSSIFRGHVLGPS